MKTRVFSCVLFAVAGSLFAAGCSTVANPRAIVHPVTGASRPDTATVVRGSPLNAVYASIGYPRYKLTRDVWLYDDFCPTPPLKSVDDCSLLIVTFDQDRVADLQLANRSAERQLSARLRSQPAAKPLFATAKN
jgi:hypothetical protein